jgi:hypothetical protein
MSLYHEREVIKLYLHTLTIAFSLQFLSLYHEQEVIKQLGFIITMGTLVKLK